MGRICIFSGTRQVGVAGFGKESRCQSRRNRPSINPDFRARVWALVVRKCAQSCRRSEVVDFAGARRELKCVQVQRDNPLEVNHR